MKSLIIASSLALFASVSYAGPGCGGGCQGDKDEADSTTSSYTTADVILAGAGCGGSCSGDDKGSDTPAAPSGSFTVETTVFA